MYGKNQKRALVTGAGSGLGRALCLGLARRGYTVAVTDINVPAAEETAGLVGEAGGKASVARVDVTRAEELESAAERFFSEWGGVDLLINNAGVAAAGRMEEVTLEDWHWIMGINFWSVVHGSRAFIPRMRAQGGGHIINVASLAGIASLQYMSPYNATKAAVISLSETLKGELHPDNIGVTVVCPSFFKTNLISNYRGPADLKDAAQTLLDIGKLSADQIAEKTLRAMEKNRLYLVPHRIGVALWLMKRLSPELCFRLLHCGLFKDDPINKLIEFSK
ncbi:MAG TPA: SDR family NAD(P)-dependent oxidoreductase [bacterium]|nr:SDR family NAD(P)-dependent oxidoreductase [bacterium]